MKRLVFLVHGFWSPRGRNETDHLRPYFERAGYRVEEWDRTREGLVKVHLTLGDVAYGLRRFALFAHEHGWKVYAVGHSHGAKIIQIASLPYFRESWEEFPGAPFEQITLIDAALDNDAKFGEYMKKIHVYYSKRDWILQVARAIIPMWGNLGAVGYKGTDKRVINHEFQGALIKPHNRFFEDKFLATASQFVIGDYNA